MDQHKTPEMSRRVAEVILSTAEFGRPMMATPGTPPDRVKILRDAYARALADSGLIEEAKKGTMDMEPARGEVLQKLAREVMEQSPEVIARVKKILGD